MPARDLLDFPLGALAEAQALATQMGSGLWNPAAVGLRGADRIQVGIAALNSPVDQGVSAQLIATTYAMKPGTVLVASLARATVGDLARTETDPQSVGGTIPYETTIGSIGVSHRVGQLTSGLALRYRSGTSDYIQRGAVSVDAGVVLDRVFGTPLRVAASTFLLTPETSRESPTLLGAVDGPVYARDSTLELRGGLAVTSTRSRSTERYVFATVRYGVLEARGGVARAEEFDSITDHVRLGLGFRYGRYSVGLAREEQGAGLGATYQFLLTSAFP